MAQSYEVKSVWLNQNSIMMKRTEIALVQIGTDIINSAFQGNTWIAAIKAVMKRTLAYDLKINAESWARIFLKNALSRIDFPDDADTNDENLKSFLTAEIDKLINYETLIKNIKEVIAIS